jgi:LacI family transcriptional regulator
MAITQKEIAEKLGVSRALVGLALGGHSRVSEDTRRLILETAAQLGYQPNPSAHALVTGRTGQIALCFFSHQVTFITELMRRFQQPARAMSYQLLVSNLEALENATMPLAVDGAICYGLIPQSLVARRFPAVSLQVDLRGASAGHIGLYDVIQVALEDAARDAMKHLLARGCRRIAFVSTPNLTQPYEPRYRAYRTVMKSAGYATEEIAVEVTDALSLRADTQRALEKHFATGGFPDALFCSNDDIAIGAYRALRCAGRAIPDQTAVVGCDDIEEAQDHRPALASIHWPFDAICQSAWQMLMERIADPTLPPRFERVKAQFVPRASAQHGSTPMLHRTKKSHRIEPSRKGEEND